MTNSWDDMRKAKEGSYFERKNNEALQRLKNKEERTLTSPVSGNEMEREVLHGVVIDRCKDSGGVWLDAGELEALIAANQQAKDEEEHHDWISGFFKGLVGS